MISNSCFHCKPNACCMPSPPSPTTTIPCWGDLLHIFRCKLFVSVLPFIIWFFLLLIPESNRFSNLETMSSSRSGNVMNLLKLVSVRGCLALWGGQGVPMVGGQRGPVGQCMPWSVGFSPTCLGSWVRT